MRRPIALIASLSVTFTLFAITLFAAEPPNRIKVPRVSPPVVDGRVLPVGKGKSAFNEWKRATQVALTNGSYAMLMHDGAFLYIALVGPKPGIASLCTSGKSGIRVLHASAALGTAAFEQDKTKWRMTRGFTWTNRDTGNSPQAMAERAKTLSAEGWFANTSVTALPHREYQIAINGQTEIPIVLGFLTFTPEEQKMSYWPDTLEDDCADADLASGNTEREYSFNPTKWGVAVLQ